MKSSTKQQILNMIEKLEDETTLQTIFKIVHYYFIRDL